MGPRRTRRGTAIVASLTLVALWIGGPASAAPAAGGPTFRHVAVRLPKGMDVSQDGDSDFECPSATWCAMSVDNSGPDDVTLVLAEHDGSGWTSQRAPNPAGWAYVKDDGIGCLGVGHCVALGLGVDYTHRPVQRALLGWTLADGSWTESTLPTLPGEQLSTDQEIPIRGVSCGGGVCASLIPYAAGHGHRDWALYSYAGGEWTVSAQPAAPDPDPQVHPRVTGVGCDSGGRCWVVGSWRSTDGVRRPLVYESTGGGAWTYVDLPVPADTRTARLTSLTCDPGCAASGRYHSTGTAGGQLVSWLGAELRTTVVTDDQPAGTAGPAACLSSRICTAAGGPAPAKFTGSRKYVAYSDGGAWSVQQAAAGGRRARAFPRAAACPSAACVQLVSVHSPGTSGWILMQRTGDGWVRYALTRAQTYGVDQGLRCPAPGRCVIGTTEGLTFETS